MKVKLARRLIGLYPVKWQARYRDEFQTFLETEPASVRTVLNVIGWGLYERVLALGEFKMDQRQRSLTLMLYAYLAALAAGVNFYWTVDDTPLATAMQMHGSLFASWNLVQGGSLLALFGVAIVAIPILATMLRTAMRGHRWDVIIRLAVPLFAGLGIFAWLLAAGKFTGGHWVPTPWDVAGDWSAPSSWPPLATRWILSSVTLLLMVGGLFVSAVSVHHAIRRSDLSRQRTLWFASASTILAISITLMALGTLAWGWFVQQYATMDFHARNGGLFDSTNFASWSASCIVIVAAVIFAFKAARSAFALNTQ